MSTTTFAVGSLDALRAVLHDMIALEEHADVVIVPTAAAFTGITEAALATSAHFDDLDVRVEALMVGDRAPTKDPYFVNRIGNADLVVLCDGSALHARSVWRGNDVGEAINAAPMLVSIGAVSSVLGEVMIDPRGGAPTTGLGYRRGAALCVGASDDQMARTRSLVGGEFAVVLVGATGVVGHDGQRWRVLRGEVVVTRGFDEVEL